MSRFFRGISIVWVVLRYGLDELVLSSFQHPWLRALTRIITIGRSLDAPRGQRLREALESLGPIFVKFGQVLSTRRDLMPPDIADELARLQDRVPPFDSALALQEIEKAYGRPAHEIFAEFDPVPVASASIAQVHFARLREEDGGHEVAVKILRPNMLAVIERDVAAVGGDEDVAGVHVGMEEAVAEDLGEEDFDTGFRQFLQVDAFVAQAVDLRDRHTLHALHDHHRRGAEIPMHFGHDEQL